MAHMQPDAGHAARELAATSHTTRLDPVPASAAAARRFVLDALRLWGLSDLAEDAALCTAEVATNAILHSRSQFTVAVRRTLTGVRVDVHDDRPERLPVVVPDSLHPLDTGITGRGLMLIAATARRWGYFTTDIAKTVWFELTSDPVEQPSEPVVELAEHEPSAAAWSVRLIDMPVRAAIASGIQVDELVRELQLDPARLSAKERDLLHELLDRSAGPRLVGRQAAFRAAAEGNSSYTLDLAATPDEAAAVAALTPLLARLATQGEIEAAAVADGVLAMRAWITTELAAQAAGEDPTPYRG
jgi:anti-sigma regulatory factor (Ser/Thr protein kinase)